jgi:hypothetical protein
MLKMYVMLKMIVGMKVVVTVNLQMPEHAEEVAYEVRLDHVALPLLVDECEDGSHHLGLQLSCALKVLSE